jgi:hypothetical protein
MLVLQKHNTEMTTAAGEAFYTLVCLHQVLDMPLFRGLFSFGEMMGLRHQFLADLGLSVPVTFQ